MAMVKEFRDPRVVELARLRLALANAAKHIDAFDRILADGLPGEVPEQLDAPCQTTENGFANRIASGMAKFLDKQ